MSPPTAVPPRRKRTTRRSARVLEHVLGAAIRIGGIGTMVSVGLILVFLAWVVAPLFMEATSAPRAAAPGARMAERPVLAGLDAGKNLAWRIGADGRLVVARLSDGTTLEERSLAGESALTCSVLDPEGTRFALGFADGRVQVGTLGFRTRFASKDAEPAAAQALGADGCGIAGSEFVEVLPGGELRLTALELALETPIQAVEGASIRALDRSTTGARDSLLVLAANGTIVLLELERTENMMTGEVVLESTRHAVPFELPSDGELPAHVLLNEGADTAYLVWGDGRLARFDLRDPEHPELVQTTDVVPGAARVTAATQLLGKSTLVFGDSSGALSAWFTVKRPDSTSNDGAELVRAHVLASSGPAITRITCSARSRVLAATDVENKLCLWNVTNRSRLVTMEYEAGSGDELAIAIAPKEDGLLVLAGGRAAAWDLDLRHPEAGIAPLFRPVWYEGYLDPEHAWQSSSGTDSFEPKLGLWPLVFGTIKATFYAMLFATPIALLAALYTSQFLSARLRAPIKATVEIMASLPSVVLGFLAGVVVAPFVETVVPAILLAFLAIPLALLASAHVVLLLPETIARRIEARERLMLTFASIAVGAWLAFLGAPYVETLLFAGDLRAWLDGRVGSAFGGWMFLLLPAGAVAVAFVWSRTFESKLRERSASWTRVKNARAQGIVFAVGALAAVAIAALFAAGLDGAGFDTRGHVFDTYVQRNSMIVGAMMGFAVIPIVFTIADDALTAVPPHLRLASIGAGATQWQTAVRVVLPTAASGIFSAIMVGLGRAVGETMIVLMATGNTPVMSWNVFDGFRTLSANIAVELPEAVVGSTHYRTLFLAALCLFGITFAFNTLAEIVRQRYRKRAARL